MKIGTPNNIEVLLHCYCSPCLHPMAHTPSVQQAICQLKAAGVLVATPKGEDGIYDTTSLGDAWVKALCNVEQPTLVYVDSNGNPLTD